MINEKYVFNFDLNPSARKGLTRLLETWDYNICPFASVNKFLDALNPEEYGCVVLDICQPGMSEEK